MEKNNTDVCWMLQNPAKNIKNPSFAHDPHMEKDGKNQHRCETPTGLSEAMKSCAGTIRLSSPCRLLGLGLNLELGHQRWQKKVENVQPRCSMYGIFTYIYPKNGPNVGKYSIHGAFGQWFSLFSGWCWLTQNHLEDENDQRIQDGWKFASDKWVKWDWTAQEQQLHSESLGESSPCPTLLCLSLNVVPFLYRKKWKTMEKG